MSGEKPSIMLRTKTTGMPVPTLVASHHSTRTKSCLATGYLRWMALLALILVFSSWNSLQGNSRFSLKTVHLVGKVAEDLFLSVPNEASALAASRQYAAKPHLAGSMGDLATAKDFLALLQNELGIHSHLAPVFPAGSQESRNATLSIPKLVAPQAWIDVYYPVMNTPLDRRLEVLDEDGRPIWQADLEEHADATDPEARKYADAVPTFHGLSRGGEAEGKLVYANYGRKEDYDALVANGVDLKGTIVITRYGSIFRGLKVKGAQELGAVGVLIYSDPRDDGTVTCENGYTAYPHGPARNPTSVQRGSVQFISTYPGDPSTPNRPAYENATRTEGTNIPNIPSLPISWANAEVLLKEINGEGRTVRLVNHIDEKITPIWNTLGVIPGYIKDEIVVIGNHRDAWVMGATDPSSGTASVHEVVRGLGALLKKGWQPLRTILIASWDAEEYGLIGSTEWGEDFGSWIDEHVVAYVNLDSSTSGSRFRASASPSLAHLVRQTAEEIPHPTDIGRTLWDATEDFGTLFGERADGQIVFDSEAAAVHIEEAMITSSLGVQPLGSGSDYTVFLQHIGVASSNGGFGSTLSDPVYHYHSVFDSERWQELYGDPGFFRHVAVAKHVGLQVMRLSSSIVLPINTTHYAYELEGYLDEVEKVIATSSLSRELDLTFLRKAIHSLQKKSTKLDIEKHKAERKLRHVIKKLKKRHTSLRRLKKKVRNIICRFKRIFGHKCEWGGGHVNKEPPSITRENGIQVMPRIGRYPAWREEQREHEERALAYGFALEAGLGDAFPSVDSHSGSRPSCSCGRCRLKHAVKRVQAVNKKLVAFERGFISEDGIKDREWYKHLVVAPGKWLGYGATTFPALTESVIYDRNSTLAKLEAGRLEGLIKTLTKKLKV